MNAPRCSAFTPLVSNFNSDLFTKRISFSDALHKSFIVVRNKPIKVTVQRLSKDSNGALGRSQSKTDHEDSESTLHSNDSKPQKIKLTKEQKRQGSLASIKKFIESRKVDTLTELAKMDDEDTVLKASPKKNSINSKLSHFRGVSNNGRKWQVMIMGFAKKIYFGGINSEKEASHKYDKYAIMMHGLEVRDFNNLNHCFIG